ncbi:hypothetical protein [Bacillus sp. MRMR6]|uniref:hypothetical protein n=1 Tax=Bacillus sp. MRMR6 TaxID=1928617 RepID=UPI000952419E|nr:hypothetical protein [Bacillus sp. MRMR6]OLS41522.1 hypothetical protein BTR25_02930 [Bacillus sp. MRMR6]
MVSLFWAFGSMLTVMLIISFLPLGITVKGKLTVVFVGFVLALGGLAAVSTFSVWAALVLLLVLSFFAAYIMDSRLSASLYTLKLQAEDVVTETNSVSYADTQQAMSDELDFLDLSEVQMAPTLEEAEGNLDIEVAALSLEKEDTLEIIDDEISFLQDRNVDQDIIVEEHIKEEEPLETGYLSEIENMLLDESETDDLPVLEEEDWLAELEDFAPETKDDKAELDNHLLEELFIASKEAASDKEETPLKKLELQK